MGMRRLPALLMGMTSVSHGQSAALRPNGTVIRHAPCEFGSYAEQSAFTRRYYTNQEFELPRAGFIVVATQYRGNDGGTGREELGGADVSDVVNLFRVAANLPSSDTANTFLYGVSRGGMMTMLTLKRGVTPNAAAVVGAVFDLDTTLKYTQTIAPQIAREVKSLIPSYDRDSVRALSDRSAIQWPEKVNVPLLIIHGAGDEEVPVTQALEFARRLGDLGKTYLLVIYAGGNHEVATRRKERDREIISWFKSHLRNRDPRVILA